MIKDFYKRMGFKKDFYNNYNLKPIDGLILNAMKCFKFGNRINIETEVYYSMDIQDQEITTYVNNNLNFNVSCLEIGTSLQRMLDAKIIHTEEVCYNNDMVRLYCLPFSVLEDLFNN